MAHSTGPALLGTARRSSKERLSIVVVVGGEVRDVREKFKRKKRCWMEKEEVSTLEIPCDLYQHRPDDERASISVSE